MCVCVCVKVKKKKVYLKFNETILKRLSRATRGYATSDINS